MPKTPKQTLVDTSQDPGLNYLSKQDANASSGTRRVVPTDSGNVFTQYIPVNQFVYNIVETTNQISGASGSNGEIQFNEGGQISSDSDLKYDPNTDTLEVKTILVKQHAHLGSVTDIKIDGGVSGQVLTTDGLGNLTWSVMSGGGGGVTSYNDLTDKPTLFSGDYNDLINQPTIPSINGLASESYVDSAVSGSVTGLASTAYVDTAIAGINISGGSFDGTQQIHISNTNVSTSTTTGALRVDGGVGITGNLNVGGREHYFDGNVHITGVNSKALYVGSYADSTTFTAPTLIMKNDYQTYVQAGLINSSQYGSSDWVAYADNGSDNDGWADMGMTSHNFSDINYSITGKNDGYFFVKAVQADPSLQLGGNLVIATSNTGTHNDIVFGLGGFYTDNVFARMSHANAALEIQGNVVARKITTSTGADLGSASSVRITGGASGQVLTTDGAGNLSWTASIPGPAGATGQKGDTGAQGIPGSTGAQGAPGAKGDKGDTGAQGVSVTLIGSVPTSADLPTPGGVGEGYIVTDTGNLWFWNSVASSWNDIGKIVGPQGDQGPQGPAGSQGAEGPQGPAGNNGVDGVNGVNGIDGTNGADGVGVPAGGFTGQILAKLDDTDYNTAWINHQTFDQTLNTTDNVNFQDVTLSGKLIAHQAEGTIGGYSFGGNEGGYDSGMFSSTDGVVDFYSNNVKIATIATGGLTLTQPITLPADPTNALEAATKQYVDNSISGISIGNPFNQALNTTDAPTFAGISLTSDLQFPNYVKQSSPGSIVCSPNMDTIIYTGTSQWQHTFKLLLKVEGNEVQGQNGWDTQSCEMMIAKSFINNKVAGSVYGLVYTSANPLATFTTRWNATSNRVEVLCRPTSTTEYVAVRSFVTEITTSD